MLVCKTAVLKHKIILLEIGIILFVVSIMKLKNIEIEAVKILGAGNQAQLQQLLCSWAILVHGDVDFAL